MKIHKVAIRFPTENEMNNQGYSATSLNTTEEVLSEMKKSMIHEKFQDIRHVSQALKIAPYVLIKKDGARYAITHLHTGLIRLVQNGQVVDPLEMPKIIVFLDNNGYL